jgi:DNA-binding response OmpR family regulator
MPSASDRPETVPVSWHAAYQAVPVHAPPRILVAEDDRCMRQLIAEAMRSDGFEVLEAETGGRLLVLLAHQIADDPGPDLVDLVISDVRMPVCSGTQILEQMRSANWRTPVILMTAFSDRQVRAHTQRLGGILFDKPFELEDLRTAVTFLLGLGRPTPV